jgi:hypothetical protein
VRISALCLSLSIGPWVDEDASPDAGGTGRSAEDFGSTCQTEHQAAYAATISCRGSQRLPVPHMRLLRETTHLSSLFTLDPLNGDFSTRPFLRSLFGSVPSDPRTSHQARPHALLRCCSYNYVFHLFPIDAMAEFAGSERWERSRLVFRGKPAEFSLF